MVRPVRDILGEKTIPLRIIEPPKANSVRATDGSVLTQVMILHFRTAHCIYVDFNLLYLISIIFLSLLLVHNCRIIMVRNEVSLLGSNELESFGK